jgi:hypothetical protein
MSTLTQEECVRRIREMAKKKIPRGTRLRAWLHRADSGTIPRMPGYAPGPLGFLLREVAEWMPPLCACSTRIAPDACQCGNADASPPTGAVRHEAERLCLRARFLASDAMRAAQRTFNYQRGYADACAAAGRHLRARDADALSRAADALASAALDAARRHAKRADANSAAALRVVTP